jgi:putative glycosyltransferase
MLLSVVTRVYQSSGTLRAFHEQIRAAAGAAGLDLEMILVNDGSVDDSLAIAKALVSQHPGVRLIDLSRAFGHDPALLTGLQHASGDLIFTADCNEPFDAKVLLEYRRVMIAEEADSVYNASSPGMTRLMSRSFLQSVLQFRDREVYLPGMYELAGYRQVPVAAPCATPSQGFRTWLQRQNVEAEFSGWPLLLVSSLGTFVLAVASGAALCLIIYRTFFGKLLPGWPSLVVSIWLLGGLVLFCLGVLALYLRKILLEVRDRPEVVVREVLRPGMHQRS